MKLQKKISRSTIIIVLAALIVSYLLTILVVYRQTLRLVEDELVSEADYMIAAVNIAGEDYLEDLDAVRRSTRVTLIDEQGDVLYDYVGGAKEENHKRRPEVIEALKSGSGKDVRKSVTTGKDTVYFAKMMEDGRIFRVSKSIDTALVISLRILPWIGLIMLVMCGVSWRISKWQVKKIIAPLNQMDLEDPMKNQVYEELTPLLVNIDELNKEKEKIGKMRKEFTANVSHELKTPLTSISGYAELMKDGLVKKEDMAEFSNRIYGESKRMISLIEDVIQLSRLDEEVEVEKEEIDLFELTLMTVNRLSPMAAKYKVHIKMTGEPVTITGIKKVIEEMVQNLCENAIKYNKENGEVTVWVGKTLQGIKISVADTGIGIPKNQLDRVFERFYRVDVSHSKEVEGTGLGLSIVKHGAILHDAKIQIDSEKDQGTKVEIVF